MPKKQGFYTSAKHTERRKDEEPPKPKLEITVDPAVLDAVLEKAKARQHGCFLCKWIAEDVGKNNALTDYPKDFLGSDNFPVQAKLIHIGLEGLKLKKAQVGDNKFHFTLEA